MNTFIQIIGISALMTSTTTGADGRSNGSSRGRQKRIDVAKDNKSR